MSKEVIITILITLILIFIYYFKTRKVMGYEEIYKEITDIKLREDYSKLRVKIISDVRKNLNLILCKDEKLRFIKLEKERINRNTENWKYDNNRELMLFMPIVTCVLTLNLSQIIGISDNNQINKAILIFLISNLIIIIFTPKFHLYERNNKIKNDKIVCGQIYIDILEELEKKILENDKLNNINDVLEEIASTDECIDDVICETDCKVKNNSIIEFFKKMKFKKEIKSKEKLSKEFKNFKILSRDKLVENKCWYLKQAKMQRDSAVSIKNMTKTITILMSIIALTVPIMMQVVVGGSQLIDSAIGKKIQIIELTDIKNDEKIEQMNEICKTAYDIEFPVTIVEMILGNVITMGIFITLMLGGIEILAVLHDNKAAHYETLVQYIDELIKD